MESYSESALVSARDGKIDAAAANAAEIRAPIDDKELTWTALIA
jgi:hypothetical protein